MDCWVLGIKLRDLAHSFAISRVMTNSKKVEKIGQNHMRKLPVVDQHCGASVMFEGDLAEFRQHSGYVFLALHLEDGLQTQPQQACFYNPRIHPPSGAFKN